MNKEEQLLRELQEQVKDLRQQAELIKTVLIVKEPNTIHSAEAFEGLRKSVVASTQSRRGVLRQLISISVAINRAKSLDDLRPQVEEWLAQAGLATLSLVPDEQEAAALFEDIGDEGLDGPIEVVEPAYVEIESGSLLRQGRARLASVEGAEA
jgi:hypothetical protein